jgi:hypothetical protein
MDSAQKFLPRRLAGLAGLALALLLTPAALTAQTDSDGDRVADYIECPGGAFVDTDGDGIGDCQDADDDGDGVPTIDEWTGDSDGDGVADYHDRDDDGDGIPTEVEYDPGSFGAATPDEDWNDVDGDGIPNHLDLDSDGDGDSDRQELYGDAGLPPVFSSVPQMHTIDIRLNDLARLSVVEPVFPDGDGDGIPNWLDSQDEDGPDGDADGDGVLNRREEKLGSDPYDFDTDGDGIEDGDEHGDSDGDGVPNRLDADDDGDRIPTREEGTSDIDGDGIANSLDLDSDGRPDSADATPFGPCLGDAFELPDGDNVELGRCTDRDCDGIADNQESTAQVYVGGGKVHFFSRNEDGEWQAAWIEQGNILMPALCDGPCALEDYDCDLIPNCADPDWTDGPGKNGTGNFACSLLN